MGSGELEGGPKLENFKNNRTEGEGKADFRKRGKGDNQGINATD